MNIKDIAETQEATESARVASLTDRQKAREVFDNFVATKGIAKKNWARIAVETYSEYLSEKQIAWAGKVAGL